jgi:uncharacterized protein YdcH (DUF465 family)
MPTPKAFHGCFGRLMRDASDSSDWITVDRSKDKKKVGAFRQISNSNRVLDISFSNSKNAMMHPVVAPKVQTSSFANGTNRSVSFKHDDKNSAKKSSVQVKKPKNSLEKSYEAFSKDLKQVVKNHELLQGSLERIDTNVQKVKKELRDNADLLLLHKGLVTRLKQFQINRHPILSTTKDFDKIEQRYKDYLKAVDTYRDIVGKLKIHSVKFKEQLGNWKQETRKFTYLLNDIMTEELIEKFDDQDDCIAASSSASVFSDYECQENPRDWIEHHKCRFIHDERKPLAKLRHPVCPIQIPKRTIMEHHKCNRHDNPMETPVIDENGILAKKIKELQLQLENHLSKKQLIDHKIINLQDELSHLKQHDAHYDTIGECHEELSSTITEGAWIEKELVRLSSKIDNLRKRQGFTKVAIAFMATILQPDDPFQVTTSLIHSNASEEHHRTTHDPFDNALYYENSELQEDNRKLQTATAQLQEELAKVKAELTQIYLNLDNAEKASNSNVEDPPRPADTTTSVQQIQDLLSSTTVPPTSYDMKIFNTDENALQAKLAKELIKLANSYKIAELTFDVQASKRRFNFSTWFSKMQTILSMFPQTASVIQHDGKIGFYQNTNDFGNKALFLLIGSKVDTYFQRAIRHFAGQGDKALAFIQSQCANISNEDKSHFHHAFTTLRIKESESATAFIKRFIFAKTEAESAGNLYSEHDLISFVLTSLNFSKNPKYDTALQLYRLEREHGKMSFTLEDIEKRFFSMDEQTAREKILTRIALGNATNSSNSLKRGQHHKNGKGKGRSHRKSNASTNAASNGKPVICYNCGEEGHIAPKCPHPKIPQVSKRPTAKGRAATTTSTAADDADALVCSARVINYAHNTNEIIIENDDTVRPTNLPNVNYENNVTLTKFLTCSLYATIWFETLDTFTPSDYAEHPRTEAFTHDHPMEEDLLDYATIFELNNTDTVHQSYRQIVKEGIMPAVQKLFIARPWDYPVQFQLWLDAIRFFVKHKLLEQQCATKENTYLTVTNMDSCIQLTFYPVGASRPTLHLRASTRQYFFTYDIPSFYAQAAMVDSKPRRKSKVKFIKTKDPSIDEIGEPSNLNNCLPDSGATQHMTPRLADLIDTVEGQNLGVEVADGHMIKCSVTGKIRISMQDDNGSWLNATLSEVMYVPGLSRRLFSVTQFAQHGHRAIIQQHGTTLLFGTRRAPVTIPYQNCGKTMASNLSIVNQSEESTYHKVPTYCNKDPHKTHVPLELLLHRLGHRKCWTLLAANEHNLWEDSTIRMTGETGCLMCGIATIRSRARNKEAHSGATRAGEYLFLDIQHPLVKAGLTISTSYAFYLLIVDAYSRYVKLYGLPKKSTSALVAALREYHADHSPTGTYGYLNTEKIRADAGSQFTSSKFAEYCIQNGIKLGLAAPKKQYQNHLAERTWQTVTSTARSLLIHARLPDTFWFHALVYSTYIFNALPVRGLRGEDTDVPTTPHELFFGTKPRIGHLRTFGCPVVIRKWTSSDKSNGKQTERGIRGIFIGFDMHQKGYIVYCPGSRIIVISNDVLFDEQFSSAIALTWQKYQDGLALRPLASFIPDVSTTLEQTGVFSIDPAQVEEGDENLIDLTAPSDTPTTDLAPDETAPDNAPALVPQDEDDEDNLPALVPQDGDDLSTAESDDDSVDDDDPLDDASVSDIDISDFFHAADPEPEPDTPQPLRRSTRPRKPNPRYASVASIVSWENLCEDEELQEACAVEVHAGSMPSKSNALSWEPAPKTLRDILKMPDGPVKTAWLQSVRKEFKTLVDNNTFVHDTPRKGESVTPIMETFKVKILSDGSLDKLKTRIVVRGDLQSRTLTEDKWSPTASFRALKMFLAHASVSKLASNNWILSEPSCKQRPGVETLCQFPLSMEYYFPNIRNIAANQFV